MFRVFSMFFWSCFRTSFPIVFPSILDGFLGGRTMRHHDSTAAGLCLNAFSQIPPSGNFIVFSPMLHLVLACFVDVFPCFSRLFRHRFLDDFPITFFMDFGPKMLLKRSGEIPGQRSKSDTFPQGSFLVHFGRLRAPFGDNFGHFGQLWDPFW